MIRVSAPARLHFGLLHVAGPGVSPRQFGGCGLMLAAPRVAVRVGRAAAWVATGPESARALEFARRAAAGLASRGALRVVVETCPPHHTGLGVGTALALAVARGVTALCGHSDPSADELARLTGRGERSAVGARGAAVGGFVIDGGRGPAGGLGPQLARLDFPDWPVVLARPRGATPWHGAAERAAFARPRDPEAATRTAERMAHLLLLGVWPAVLERDYPAFADALHHYNRLAGEPFAAEQGGVYASPGVERLIGVARRAGGLAAGQSSWGPTLFAICPDADAAECVAHSLTVADRRAEVLVTRADARGSVVSECADQPDEEHVGGED